MEDDEGEADEDEDNDEIGAHNGKGGLVGFGGVMNMMLVAGEN